MRLNKGILLILIFALGLALAQTDPVSYRLEAYVVSEVTAEDGSKEERFTQASTARPGQVVEYRLFVLNEGETTLPSGTVVLTGPVPEGTSFLAGSATPSSERLLTEFSADGGETFSEPPVIITVTDDQGQENRVIAEPETYTAVRWTLLVPLEPNQEESFFYRVIIR